MAYVHRLVGLLLLVMLTFSSSPATAQQEAMAQPVLSEEQIMRFINSYPKIHAMARDYWGKRQYTPAHKMLKSEGTFERALTEMKHAGKLPEFDNLLQSAGFDGRETWMKLTNRMSLAYMILRLNEIDPSRVESLRERRTQELARVRQKLSEAMKKFDGTPTLYIRNLRRSRRRLEQEAFAEKDAEALRPFYERFEAMNNTIEEYRR
ncbi:MAG: hypothetical protein AAF942_08355 [Pseudomonadota bacterium]